MKWEKKCVAVIVPLLTIKNNDMNLKVLLLLFFNEYNNKKNRVFFCSVCMMYMLEQVGPAYSGWRH
jgi:hypothetical protein